MVRTDWQVFVRRFDPRAPHQVYFGKPIPGLPA